MKVYYYYKECRIVCCNYFPKYGLEVYLPYMNIVNCPPHAFCERLCSLFNFTAQILVRKKQTRFFRQTVLRRYYVILLVSPPKDPSGPLLPPKLGLYPNTLGNFFQTDSQFAFENDPFLSLKYLVFVTDQAISKIHYLPWETTLLLFQFCVQ